MFLSGRYAEALPLALAQLDLEEDNLGKDGREIQLLDMCINLALKTNEAELAGNLAERGLAKLDVRNYHLNMLLANDVTDKIIRSLNNLALLQRVQRGS